MILFEKIKEGRDSENNTISTVQLVDMFMTLVKAFPQSWTDVPGTSSLQVGDTSMDVEKSTTDLLCFKVRARNVLENKEYSLELKLRLLGDGFAMVVNGEPGIPDQYGLIGVMFRDILLQEV